MLISSFLYVTVVFLGTVLFVKYHWGRRKLYKLAWQCSGPLALPIIGNALYMTAKTTTELTDVMYNMIDKSSGHPPLSRYWVGHHLYLVIKCPEYIQVVLNNTKCLKKAEVYDQVIPVQGYGLFTAPVDIWKRHRKIISPAFNQKMLDTFVPIYNGQSEVMVVKIRETLKIGEKVDIFHKMCLCTLDIICETALGLKINAQTQETRHLHVMQRLMHIALLRMLNVYYQFDFIFNRLPIAKEFVQLRAEMHELVNGVIRQKRKEMSENQDVLEYNEAETKKKAFLEMLIDLSKDGQSFTDTELLDETIAFIFGGSDTTATINCFICTMLGMHPDIQNKVREEIDEVFGDSDRPVSLDDLSRLQYLERVIKETLRLFPVAMGIARATTEDFMLRDTIIPAGTKFFVSMMNVQRDPNYWPDPLKFDPDRFLPDEVAKRHPCTFLPFSAGPRNCIGMRYAYMSMKTVMSNILRNFTIKTAKYNKVEDIKLDWKMVLHPIEGFQVTLDPRHK